MPNRSRKRHSRPADGPDRTTQPTGPSTTFFSAATLFRVQLVDRRTHALLRRIPAALKPFLLARDREQIEQIKQASSPGALIDLAPLATGLAEATWHDRMRGLGPEVLPLIVERLAHAHEIRDVDQRNLLREKLIGELRWRGDAGAAALLACFNTLDDHGRSLASVALGLLGARAGAGRIWDFYGKAVRNARASYFVGALWGLIDLQDMRTGGALVDLLHRQQLFYELPGFLARNGDVRAVVPLLHTIIRVPDDERYDLAMALTAIAHRIGRDALVAELDKTVPAERSRELSESRAGQILERPASVAEEHFALFYRGLTPEDLAQVIRQ